MINRFAAVGLVCVAGLAMSASAQTTFNNSVTPNWQPGTGIPNAGFVTNDNVGAAVQTGLTSFYRFGVRNPGDFALRDSLTANTYTYRSGESFTDGTATSVAPGTAAWNFSWHINLNTTPGGSLGQNFTNNTVLLTIDWDPTAGVDQRTYNLSTLLVGAGAGSLTFLQSSQNPGFSFWDSAAWLAGTGSTARTAPFNPNALGTYRMQLDIIRGGNNISSTEMFVNVVPGPGAAALLGLGGLAMGRRRR
jgi:hypothetical protein